MVFKPGNCANPGGKPKQKIWRDAISAAIRHRTGLDQIEAVKTVALALVDEALKGDVVALKEIGDRIDGKSDASVSVDHTGSITHEHEGVSDTLGWLRGIAREPALGETKKPVLN